jgi:hypothetical protein
MATAGEPRPRSVHTGAHCRLCGDAQQRPREHLGSARRTAQVTVGPPTLHGHIRSLEYGMLCEATLAGAMGQSPGSNSSWLVFSGITGLVFTAIMGVSSLIMLLAFVSRLVHDNYFNAPAVHTTGPGVSTDQLRVHSYSALHQQHHDFRDNKRFTAGRKLMVLVFHPKPPAGI